MKYKWPIPSSANVTAKWDEPRPMTNPGKHVHGGIDIATKIGTDILAPEQGSLFLYYAIRNKETESWPNDGTNTFPWKNYFYDMFGGIIVLKGDSGLTHLFAHSYINQLYNKSRHDWEAIEEKKASRFPLTAMMAGGIRVYQGDKIGEVGNAGYSSGPHCHYEIHNGFKWDKWEDRPDPLFLEYIK